jgi:hypothetical protein
METKINWANDYEINEGLKEFGTSIVATAIRIMSKLDETKYKELYDKLDKESDEIQEFLYSKKFYATEEEANKAVDSLVAKLKEFEAIEEKILSERGS